LIKAILSYRYFLSLKIIKLFKPKHRMNWEQLLSLKDKATQALRIEQDDTVWVLK
jgi:hypothetical protein